METIGNSESEQLFGMRSCPPHTATYQGVLYFDHLGSPRSRLRWQQLVGGSAVSHAFMLTRTLRRKAKMKLRKQMETAQATAIVSMPLPCDVGTHKRHHISNPNQFCCWLMSELTNRFKPITLRILLGK